MANEKVPAKDKFSNGHEAPKHVVLYYDKRDGGYWLSITGEFVALKRGELTMQMKTLGLNDDKSINTGKGMLRETDWPLWDAFNHRRVAYAGPLAGHKIGVFTDNSGKQFLITEQASGVFCDLPKKVSAPKFYLQFIQELLPDDQWSHFCHWLAIALRSLRRGDFKPGQVAVLAGPAQCGKSLLQYIITQVLGGRCADPFEYMNGGKFSADLVGAEHWQIEDPNSTTDLRTRRAFGNKLKECANNESFNAHPKGKDATKVQSVFRRISVSVNDETENLAVIPPMEDSIRDKISLYKCSNVVEALNQFTVTTPALDGFGDIIAAGEQDRSAIKKKIADELPMLRAWLVKTFNDVPQEWADRRAGLKAYHHPELMDALCKLSPELRMLQIIDEVCFKDNEGLPWMGKAMELEKQLRESAFNFECEKILRYGNACGTYLGRLQKQFPNRVSSVPRDGYTTWTIKQPSKERAEAA